LAETGEGIMDILDQPALGHLPVGEDGNEFKISLTPKLCVLCERRVSRQGAKIAKVKGIPENDSLKVVRVFMPR
jgi:hypothetical protein